MDKKENKQKRRMRWILFCVFMLIFVVVTAFTIAKVFLDFGSPTPGERKVLFKMFIAEVGGAVLMLFKVIFSLKKKAGEEVPQQKLAGKYCYEIISWDKKIKFLGECRIKQHGRKLDFNGERKKFISKRKKENIAVHWYSQWGELCLDNKVRLDYLIAMNGGARGYAILDFDRTTGKTMVGEFFQLGENYVYGTVKFKRV